MSIIEKKDLISIEYLQAKELVLSGKSFNIDNFVYIKDEVEKYMEDNPNVIENNMISQFLNDKYNEDIFALALIGEKEMVDLLNERFKEFYFEYRFIAYICKLLHYEAINFDRRSRKLLKDESIILDMPIIEGSNLKLAETISREETEFEIKSDIFDDCIIDENLYKAYKDLNIVQQKILCWTYYSLLKDAEIAKKLNVTKQAISKNRIKALKTLKYNLGGRK